MTLKPTLVRQAVRRWSKQSEFSWRYLLNLGPTLSYAFRRPEVTGEAARVLAHLNREGIAITSVDALFGDRSQFQELFEESEQRQAQLATEMSAARKACESLDAHGQKPFLFFLLGSEPRLDIRSVFARFALSAPVAGIANAYFGMHCSLSTYNIWYNFVTAKGPTQSQLWHRDPEDRYILKVFLCLSDVTDGAGPFTYAPGTHPKGAIRKQPAFLFKDGSTTRSDDSQMAAVVPPAWWIKGTGPVGTIIFADTRGYHKGGLSRECDRILYIAEFLSPVGGHGISTTRGVS